MYVEAVSVVKCIGSHAKLTVLKNLLILSFALAWPSYILDNNQIISTKTKINIYVTEEANNILELWSLEINRQLFGD